jgi:hypothetical protein
MMVPSMWMYTSSGTLPLPSPSIPIIVLFPPLIHAWITSRHRDGSQFPDQYSVLRIINQLFCLRNTSQLSSPDLDIPIPLVAQMR